MLIEEAYSLNCPLYVKKIGRQEGNLPERFSLIHTDSRNVVVETIKRAEENKDVIVRVYEAFGQRSNVKIKINIQGLTSIWECDLLENKLEQCEFKDGSCYFQIKPFEIKTFRIITM